MCFSRCFSCRNLFDAAFWMKNFGLFFYHLSIWTLTINAMAANYAPIPAQLAAALQLPPPAAGFSYAVAIDAYFAAWLPPPPPLPKELHHQPQLPNDQHYKSQPPNEQPQLANDHHYQPQQHKATLKQQQQPTSKFADGQRGQTAPCMRMMSAGGCRYGTDCWFSHDIPSGSTNTSQQGIIGHSTSHSTSPSTSPRMTPRPSHGPLQSDGKRPGYCHEFQRGSCMRGASCHFLHEKDPASEKPCWQFVRAGSCDYRNCRFRHVSGDEMRRLPPKLEKHDY
jgi:hypothetical protein